MIIRKRCKTWTAPRKSSDNTTTNTTRVFVFV